MGLKSFAKKATKKVTKPFNKAVEKLTGGRIGGIGELAKKSALATAGFFGLKGLGSLLPTGAAQTLGNIASGAGRNILGGAGSGFNLGSLAGPLIGFAGDLLGAKLAKDNYTEPYVDWTGAKEGLGWRVDDAKRAGIHPLYALGAGGVGAGAVVGGSQGPSAGEAVSNFGQNIQYMMSQRAQLNNALVAAQVRNLDARTQSLLSSPPTDVNAVTNRPQIGAIEVEPDKITSAAPGKPEQTAGTGPGMKEFIVGTTPKGRKVTVRVPGTLEDSELTRTLVEAGEVLGITKGSMAMREFLIEKKNMIRSRFLSRRGTTRKQRRQYRDWRN